MAGVATLQFFGRLSGLLSCRAEDGNVRYRFDGSPAIKDAIEALGIPHTEVDLIFVAGESVGFDHRLQDGNPVAVYPLGLGPSQPFLRHLTPAAPAPPAFILDVHLGKLARRLRLLGFDCRYRNDYPDPEIIRLALAEQRVILTRDRGILKQGVVRLGLLLDSPRPDQQVRQVLERFHLRNEIRPFRRCPLCNGLLEPVDRDQVLHRLLPNTARSARRFRRCRECDKLYWQGAHHARLLAWVTALSDQ